MSGANWSQAAWAALAARRTKSPAFASMLAVCRRLVEQKEIICWRAPGAALGPQPDCDCFPCSILRQANNAVEEAEEELPKTFTSCNLGRAP